MFVTRRSELFSVERSAIGVVVEPFSDRIQLKPVPGGFALLADDAGGLSAPRSFADGQAAETGMTHILDVKPTTTAELGRRLREQLVTAASTPARARLPARLAAAQTLLELGMGREAGTLIRVAFADDPSASSIHLPGSCKCSPTSPTIRRPPPSAILDYRPPTRRTYGAP